MKPTRLVRGKSDINRTTLSRKELLMHLMLKLALL
jgi:hypothetical protein